MQLTFFKILDFASNARLSQFWGFCCCRQAFQLNCLTKHSISLRWSIFAFRKIVEKEIDRSNATVPGDDKIGSRVSWWFAGSARYPRPVIRPVSMRRRNPKAEVHLQGPP